MLDGTHITCTPPANERDMSRNCKGFVSQNCLICCDFDMHFTYVLCGWEGSMANATIYHDAQLNDLAILCDKYYLANAGYLICHQLLVPYHKQWYHLVEWGHAQNR